MQHIQRLQSFIYSIKSFNLPSGCTPTHWAAPSGFGAGYALTPQLCHTAPPAASAILLGAEQDEVALKGQKSD